MSKEKTIIEDDGNKPEAYYAFKRFYRIENNDNGLGKNTDCGAYNLVMKYKDQVLQALEDHWELMEDLEGALDFLMKEGYSEKQIRRFSTTFDRIHKEDEESAKGEDDEITLIYRPKSYKKKK